MDRKNGSLHWRHVIISKLIGNLLELCLELWTKICLQLRGFAILFHVCSIIKKVKLSIGYSIYLYDYYCVFGSTLSFIDGNCRLIISCSQSKSCLSNPIVYVSWSLRLCKFGSSDLYIILNILIFTCIYKPINIWLKKILLLCTSCQIQNAVVLTI